MLLLVLDVWMLFLLGLELCRMVKVCCLLRVMMVGCNVLCLCGMWILLRICLVVDRCSYLLCLVRNL